MTHQYQGGYTPGITGTQTFGGQAGTTTAYAGQIPFHPPGPLETKLSETLPPSPGFGGQAPFGTQALAGSTQFGPGAYAPQAFAPVQPGPLETKRSESLPPSPAFGGQPFAAQAYAQPYRAPQPFGAQSFGQQPYGAQAFGQQPYGAAFQQQPFAQPPYAAQPVGQQPYGQPFAGTPYGGYTQAQAPATQPGPLDTRLSSQLPPSPGATGQAPFTAQAFGGGMQAAAAPQFGGQPYAR